MGTIKFTVYHETNSLCFQCEDTGSGISQKFIHEKLWKPFSQESISITSEKRGIGLGLFLSKMLIEKMGGTIDLHSVEGKGTTVIVKIPFEYNDTVPVFQVSNQGSSALLISSDDSLSPLPVSPQSNTCLDSQTTASKMPPLKLSNSSEKGKEINVLIVDDNSLNRKVLGNLLKRIGFQCSIVSSGQEAVDYIKQALVPPHFILMDLFMPVISSNYEFLLSLKFYLSFYFFKNKREWMDFKQQKTFEIF